MAKWDFPWDVRMVQHIQINVIHHINRMKGKKYMIMSIRHRKSIWQNATSGLDKKKVNKIGIEGTYLSTIKAMYEKPTTNIIINEGFPTKIWNKTKTPAFTTSIEQSTGSSNPSNYARKRKKRHPNWKGRSKIYFVHRWHDIICRKLWRLHKKTIRVNKLMQQICRVQNEHMEMCCVSIH